MDDKVVLSTGSRDSSIPSTSRYCSASHWLAVAFGGIVTEEEIGDLGEVLWATIRGRRQRLPRLVRIEGEGICFDMARNPRGNPRQGRQAVATAQLGTICLSVEGIGEGLAHLLVLEWLLFQIKHQIDR